MSKAIQDCYEWFIDLEEDIEELEALNTNTKETGISIFRKVKCNWKVRDVSLDLRGLLCDFYYIDSQKTNGAEIKNYVMDPNMLLFGKKKSLKIAISPLTKEKTIETSLMPYNKINPRTGNLQKFFCVEKVLHEDDIKEVIKDNIFEAGKEKADILVFPEMIGTREMLKDIKNIMENSQKEKPSLVVFPSIWEKTQDNVNNSNISCLLYKGEEIIFEQYKRCRFRIVTETGNIYEDINCEKHNIINLLHIEGIGRICIIICYDYLKERNREMIFNSLQPTLVLSPAFSTGSFHFMTVAESGFHMGCNWVWCNTCSASCYGGKTDNFKIVGMITRLSKKSHFEDLTSMKSLCKGKASCYKKNCKHCISYAEIPLKI